MKYQDRIESKQAESFDGTNIYYEILPGDPNLPTLILVHGVGGTLTAWNPEREYLHDLGYNILAIDQRGHGRSADPDPIEAYSFDAFAQDINHIIRLEQIANPIVIGHSFGGMVSIVREAMFPNPSSSKLILIDTSYYMPGIGGIEVTNRIGQKISDFIAHRTSGRSLEQDPENYEQYAGTTDYYIPRFLFDVRNTSLHSFFATYEHIFQFKAEDLLERIACPTLVISGSADTIFPPKIQEALAHRIKNAQFDTIEGANHIIVISNAQEVASHIHKFVSGS